MNNKIKDMEKVFESFKDAYEALNEASKTPWFDKHSDIFDEYSPSYGSTSNMIDILQLLIPIWDRKRGEIFTFNKKTYPSLTNDELSTLSRIVNITKNVYGAKLIDDMAEREINNKK